MNSMTARHSDLQLNPRGARNTFTVVSHRRSTKINSQDGRL